MLPIQIEPAVDPFAGGFNELIAVTTDRSRSLLDNGGVRLRAVGSPLTLPSGRLRLTANAGFAANRVAARNTNAAGNTARRFRRDEATLVGKIEIPLASRRNDFLSDLGELSVSLEYGVVDFSDLGTFSRHTLGLIWSPKDWVRINASTSSIPRPADMRVISGPIVTTAGSRQLDFLSGNTVDVTQISGGNPLLMPEQLKTDSIDLSVSAVRSINLRLNAKYSRTETSGFISGVPPASAAIMLAFPDRFIRDTSGRLITVDVRPVNFERQRREQLRYGLNFSLPIGAPVTGDPRSPGSVEEPDSTELDAPDEDALSPSSTVIGPRPRLQFSISHTVLFRNEVHIRPELPVIDLLDGGSIGIGGSPPRHLANANVTVSGRGLGTGLSVSYRSATTVQMLISGAGAAPDTLRFAPIFIANLRAFANLGQVIPEVAWLKDTRLSFIVTNLANKRQRVTDSSGATPLNFQPGYRDPVGRTVEIEFRKLFR